MQFKIIPLEARNIPEAVALHMGAFSGYLNARLGRGYVFRVIAWLQSQPGHISLCAISPTDKRVVGYLLGAPNDYGPKMNAAVLPYAIWYALFSPRLLFDLSAWHRLVSRIPHLWRKRIEVKIEDANCMRLVVMAVSHEFKRFGVGRSLLQEFERLALEKGVTTIDLSVLKENSSAQAFYAKCGYNAEYSGEKVTWSQQFNATL